MKKKTQDTKPIEVGGNIHSAVEKAKEAINAMTKPDCTLDDYLEALEEVREELDCRIEEAKEDIARSDREIGGDEP